MAQTAEAVIIQPEITQENALRGIRLQPLYQREDGSWNFVSILSFRDWRHRDRVVAELAADKPIAFHGWGVSGIGKRVDPLSDDLAFWTYKEGRPLGSKIPLLEPPQYAVHHIDWEKVHADYRYLENPSRLASIWDSSMPFHVIFPYNRDTDTLSSSVVTPAFDPEVAPNVPVPTICIFWVKDPALSHLVKGVKKVSPGAQIGVSSLNKMKHSPKFNTDELVEYLQTARISFYKVLVEDPLLEPLDIASSHSQFAIPLKGDKPLWKVKRIGSMSPFAFADRTGFDIDVSTLDTASKAAMREGDRDLDDRLEKAAGKINRWKWEAYLKEIFHIV